MARQDTFVISRKDLRQVLISMGASEKDIGAMLSSLDRAHKHTNVVVFTNMLEKMGIDRDRMVNLFRRLGMDEVTISNAFRMADEGKIKAETGRIFEATLDFS